MAQAELAEDGEWRQPLGLCGRTYAIKETTTGGRFLVASVNPAALAGGAT